MTLIKGVISAAGCKFEHRIIIEKLSQVSIQYYMAAFERLPCKRWILLALGCVIAIARALVRKAYKETLKVRDEGGWFSGIILQLS